MDMIKRKVLGKGLDALIPNFEMGVPESETQGIIEIPLEDIIPNHNQPRKYFDEVKLKELVNSIFEKGIIQPIVVQKHQEGYEIIVGERRWRASKFAGLKKIPALIQEVSDKDLLEIAIMENIHRQDLNPLEEAQAYSKLANDFGLKQEQIAKRVGKSRASITNFIRLLKLPRKVQEDILANRLSMGHARALLGLPSEKEIEFLRRKIIRNNLNVRQTEVLVNNLSNSSVLKSKKIVPPSNIFLKNLETELGRQLGTKVKISPDKIGGKLIISYHSEEDLEQLRGLLTKN